MSSSVFKEFTSNHNDKLDSNLVIVVNKDGSVSVDQSTLHDFLANKETTNTAVSIVRVTSPTPSITEEIEKDEKLNNLDSLLNNSDEMMEVMSNSNEETTPHVSLTVENFYPPEEARKFATEIINYAGVDNPLTVETYAYARFVVFNDHCYTSIRSPNQKYPPKLQSQIQSPKQIKISEGGTLGKTKLGQTKPRSQKLSDSTDTKSESNDADNSDPQSFQDESDTESSDFSDFSENDRDSDLDFNINDRSSTRIKKNRRRRRKNLSKISRKRQSTSSMLSAVDKEMENMFSEEPENKEETPPINLNRKKLYKSPKKIKTLNMITTSTPLQRSNKPYTKKLIKQPIAPPAQSSQQQKPKTLHEKNETEKLIANRNDSNTQEIVDSISQLDSSNKQLDNKTGSQSILPSAPPPKLVLAKKRNHAHTEALISDMSSLFSTPDIIKKVGNIEQKLLTTNTNIQQTTTDQTKGGVGFMALTNTKIKHQLPAQISIQTHSSSAEYASEQDKQLDLIDSIVKQELEQNSTIPITQMNEDIPNIVKMLENPVEHMNTSLLNSTIDLHMSHMSNTNQTTNQMNNMSSHNNMMQENIVNNMDLSGGNNSLLLMNNPDDGLTEDLLQHVAELVENKNLQEIIDKQVLGVQCSSDQSMTTSSVSMISNTDMSSMQSHHQPLINNLQQPQMNIISSPIIQKGKSTGKEIPGVRKEPIQIVRSDGRVIILPPIEAPTTRGAKRRAQILPNENEYSSSPSSASTTLQQFTQNLPSDPLDLIEQHKINKKVISEPSSRDSKNNSRRSSTNSTSKMSSTASFLNESEEMDTDESVNSEDDPNRIWCLCKRPHNNRFMICCDSCLDWFHGKCVNITKVMGQQMEERGIEWTCPNCITKKTGGKDVQLSSNSLFKEIKNSTETNINKQTIHLSSSATLNSAMLEGNLLSCIVCKNQARQNSIYCSDDCIRKHAQNALVTNKTTTTINLNSSTSSSSSYQMTPKINVEKDEKIIIKQQEPWMKNKSDRVIVFERKTGRCLAGNKAPTIGNLKQWLQENPTFEVVQPGSVQAQAIQAKQQQLKQLARNMAIKKQNEQIAAAAQPQKIQTQLKVGAQKQIILFNPQKQQPSQQPSSQQQQTPQIQQQKIPVKLIKTTLTTTPLLKQTTIPPLTINKTAIKSIPVNNKDILKTPIKSNRKQSLETNRIIIAPREPEPIRVNIRKTLKEQLSLRMGEIVSDVKLTEEEIETFAIATEIEMFQLFNKDTGTKYKAKYRSLMFNIKDRKNTTLFQKICDKTIEPKQLVRMSPEELASQELAQWRENENKHQLEMIKKSELDLLACAKNYVLKTHKGEEVIESKITDRVELDPTIALEDVVAILNNSTVSSTSDAFVTTPTPSKERFDKFEKFVREMENTKLIVPPPLLKKKESSSRRSRSRSKDKHDKSSRNKSSSSSSSKHKRKRSHEKRSKSREKEKRSQSRGDEDSSSRSKSKDRVKRSRSREKDFKRKDDNSRRDKKDIKIKSSKDKESGSHRKSTENKLKKEIKILPKNEYNLIDKILEAASSQVNTDETIKIKDQPIKIQNNPETIRKTISIESDQEPTSTVIIPTPPDNLFDTESNNETEQQQQKSVWVGTIGMVDVATFQISAQTVSGECDAIKNDLPIVLEVVGRISPETVWEYIQKIKKSPNKEILIIRLSAATVSEKMAYFTLYTYLDSRKRLGVIKTTSPYMKDFYILPLASNSQLPSVLLPIGQPGFIEGEQKPDLLIGVIVKIKGKRSAAPLASSSSTAPPLPPPTKVPRKATTTTTTIPKTTKQSSFTPPYNNNDERYTPPTSPKESKPTKSGGKLTIGLPKHVQDVPPSLLTSSKDDEPYSPGGSDDELNTVPAPVVPQDEIQRKMDELNRQIAAKNMEIAGMLTKTQESMDEPYSPSRPVSPPHSAMPTLANIAIPSNLQEILASINKSVPAGSDRPESTTPPPPTIGSLTTTANDEEYIPTSIYMPSYSAYKGSSSSTTTPNVSNVVPFNFETTSTNLPPPSTGTSKLAQLSEAELMSMVPDDIILDEPKTSSSVEQEKEEVKDIKSDEQNKASKWDLYEPPPPGLEDEYEPS